MPKSIKINQFRYMTNESWRVLMAVEMGSKNHEFVPLDLVHKISRCSRGGSAFSKLLRDDLVPHGLLAYENDIRKGFSGYRLTNLGYDYLALHALVKSGQLIDLGSMIGVGKESDVYLAVAGDMCGKKSQESEKKEEEDQSRQMDLPSMGDYIVIKFHRLGRTSFRKVREKREYHQGRHVCSWLYLDRLAAKREFDMMQVLYNYGLPVPRPLANNRNAVVMSLLGDAILLSKVLPSTLRANDAILASALYAQAVDILTTITRQGLIHGDFNEFNLLVGGLETNANKGAELDSMTETTTVAGAKLLLIDFPQMISRDHCTAQMVYERDLDGMLNFFGKFLDISSADIPPRSLAEIPRTGSMDVELKAPGYLSRKPQKKSKNGPRRGHMDDSEFLVGTVAALVLDRGNSSSETNASFESDSNDEDENEATPGNSASESPKLFQLNNNEEEDKNGDVIECASIATSKQDKKTTSQAVISREEVRERKRREEKKHAQNEFRLRIKRQQRASIKNKNRAEIAAETRLFT